MRSNSRKVDAGIPSGVAPEQMDRVRPGLRGWAMAWIAAGVLVVTWIPVVGFRYAGDGEAEASPLGLVLLALMGTTAAGVLLLGAVLRSGTRRRRKT